MTINSKNGIIGLAVGDAMGVPIEFCFRDKLMQNITTEMVGGGSHGMPVGSWSDDTSMTLCLIDAINKSGDIIPKDIADNFEKWVDYADYTPTGKVFGIGRTCLQAIMNYKKGIDPVKAGLDNEFSNGNGSLMRIAPLIYYCFAKNLNEKEILEITTLVSSITHRHEISIMGCYIYVLYGVELLKGSSLQDAYNKIRRVDYSMFSDDCRKRYERIINKDISKCTIEEIDSTGYVVPTLEATIWTILTTTDFNSAIIKAINLGNDTDTVGACTGALAGIYYGLDSINEGWKNKLLKYDYINQLCEKFNHILNKE